jgi:hypothetical protein
MAERSLVNAVIRNNGGSAEHYYHFLFGYFLPLCAYMSRRTGDPPITLARECGPMNRIIYEVGIPGLLLCNRRSHAMCLEALSADARWEHVDTKGIDLHRRRQPVYDVEAVTRIVTEGAGYIRARLGASIERHCGRLQAEWGSPPRVLLIERGVPDPYYSSSVVETPGSGSSRRTITNSRELLAALKTVFGHVKNVALERLDLAEQIALFQTADVVIGQHGAGLANTLWMRRGSHVCEFIQAPEQQRTYGDLSAIYGLEHHFLWQRDFKDPVDVRESVVRISGVVDATSRAPG